MNTKQGITAIGCLAVSLLAVSLVISGCGPGQLFGLTLTPTITPTLTSTPSPTPTPMPSSSWVSEKDGMVLVYVPSGEFWMGSGEADSDASSDEKPRHQVYLDAYWIDQTEVTNAMFAKFAEETDHQTDAEKDGWAYVWTGKFWEKVNGADWQHPRGPDSNLNGLEAHPVVQVSWSDADAYCRWAERELPTEAEWEKAARGTDGRKYPWGDSAPTSSLLNFNNNVGDTTAVGSYPDGASPYDALDMAGNVWEWVADWYGGVYAN